MTLGGAKPAAESTSLSDRKLLILVGFTGAGKSTTLAALERRGVLSAILPDRREVTDKVILSAMTGDPMRRVTDRLERFSLTAAFRERHPGGMGEVLEHIGVPRWIPTGLIAFDGLRGPAEIAAASRLPQATFLYLETSADIRLARLCLRDDPFDRVAIAPAIDGRPSGDHNANQALDRMLDVLAQSGIDRMVDASTLHTLALRLVKNRVETDMAAQAAAIVSDEATHYSAAETLRALKALAQDRTVILNSGHLSPEHVADAVISRILT